MISEWAEESFPLNWIFHVKCHTYFNRHLSDRSVFCDSFWFGLCEISIWANTISEQFDEESTKSMGIILIKALEFHINIAIHPHITIKHNYSSNTQLFLFYFRIKRLKIHNINSHLLHSSVDSWCVFSINFKLSLIPILVDVKFSIPN